MARRLRAAVIGTGFVGRQHVEALRRIGVEVVVVAASEEATAVAAARSLGVARGTAAWQTAVADPDVDVVHVCVPNDLHRDVSMAAIRAGKHVVCEKPLAIDLADGLALAEASERSGRVTVLCHNYRYYTMVAELRLRVRDGALGALHAVRGAYLQDWLLSPRSTNWRVDAARGGPSRAIADIGSHWIDLAETVTDRRVESVFAQLGTVHGRRPGPGHVATFSSTDDGEGPWLDVTTEDQAALLLRFQGGLQGSVVLSQVAAGHKNDLELSIDGGYGSATWRQERPDELVIGGASTTESVARTATDLTPGVQHRTRLPAGHPEGWADALRNLLSVAYAEIQGTEPVPAEPPLPTFADGVRHLALADAALRSAAEERWVSIEEVLASQTSREEVS